MSIQFIRYTSRETETSAMINLADVSALRKDESDGLGCHVINRHGRRLNVVESYKTMSARLDSAVSKQV